MGRADLEQNWLRMFLNKLRPLPHCSVVGDTKDCMSYILSQARRYVIYNWFIFRTNQAEFLGKTQIYKTSYMRKRQK